MGSEITYEKEFTISTEEEAEKFGILLNKHLSKNMSRHFTKNIPPFIIPIDLRNLFTRCSEIENGNRKYIAIHDFFINLVLLTLDISEAVSIWNNYFSKRNTFDIDMVNKSIFDDENVFIGKLELHRAVTSYIFRFRALWDKIMGLYFLIYKEVEYEKFINAKSKQRNFIKCFKDSKLVDPQVLSYIENELVDFDNQYRTAEAHNTGKIRKATFKEGSLDENVPLMSIFTDSMNQILKVSDSIFLIFNDI